MIAWLCTSQHSGKFVCHEPSLLVESAIPADARDVGLVIGRFGEIKTSFEE